MNKPGSYKLSNYNEYSLTAQKVWSRFRQGIESNKLDWNEADSIPDKGLLPILQNLFNSEPYIKWYPETTHQELLDNLNVYCGNTDKSKLIISHGSDNALRLVLQAFTHQSKCLILSPNYDNFRAQSEIGRAHV